MKPCLLTLFLLACGASPHPSEPPASSEEVPLSPCAERCTTAPISRCITQCLIEHCARGEAVCAPSRCREIDPGQWTCEPLCAVGATIHYEPLDTDDPCITGGEIEIGRNGETTSETDDCSLEAHYSFECAAP
jgi:hypothetical protein